MSTILLVSCCVMILLNFTLYILARRKKRIVDKNLEMTYFIMRNGHNCMSQIECTPSTILYIWYLD